MPAESEIIAGLARIANQGIVFAVLWHVVAAAALAWLALGRWLPSRRVAAVAVTLPLATASLFAWRDGNPFNGTMMALALVVLALLGLRLSESPVRPGPRWATALGAFALVYGFVYPHFLAGQPVWLYLVAAPAGLVPCPTLAVILGTALLGGGFESRPWPVVASAFGLFYALFGMLRLHVWLDGGLAVISLGLLAIALELRPAGRRSPSTGPRSAAPSR